MSPKKKSAAAFPVLTLLGAIVLIPVSYAHDAPDWIYFVILGAWWVGFAIWRKYFYREN